MPLVVQIPNMPGTHDGYLKRSVMIQLTATQAEQLSRVRRGLQAAGIKANGSDAPVNSNREALVALIEAAVPE